jgi:hypothetical protein
MEVKYCTYVFLVTVNDLLLVISGAEECESYTVRTRLTSRLGSVSADTVCCSLIIRTDNIRQDSDLWT